jgi:hypothetical protein
LLAAYDLGASAKILQKIYDEDVRMQRKIDLGEKDTTIGENEFDNVLDSKYEKERISFECAILLSVSMSEGHSLRKDGEISHA